MPGCRDSEISAFCCAHAGAPGSNMASAAMAPAQAAQILFFMVHLLRRSH
jgi:hypothetical protein